jgi:hypothetical protein
MNKIIFCLSFIIGSTVLAQDKKCLTQVNFNMGKTFTSFMYEDSEGNPNENLNYRSGTSYSLNLGFKLGNKHMLNPELIYQQSGAKSTINNTPVDWSMNYIGAGIGYLYTALEKESFSLSPGLVMNANYMMSGEQTIGTNRFNITEQDLLKSIDIMATFTLNSRFKVTDNLYINFNYRYGFGLIDIENIEDENEKTRNIGHMASIGLSFNL